MVGFPGLATVTARAYGPPQRPRIGGIERHGEGLMRLLASDLACVRGGREVFSGLSFATGAGEALLISGPNGAGKSSLLRLCAGLVAPVAGQLVLDGGDPDLTVAEQAHYLGHQ